MESTIKACSSGINNFSACTIKTSQVEARCYIGGRHRPSKGEYAPILLTAIMAAKGRADVVARSLLAIMPGTDRTDEERAHWDEWQANCIAEAARFEDLRAKRAASLYGNVAAYAYTGSAECLKAAEAAQADLARLKDAQKQRKAPVGLCIQGACTVDGAPALLMQIDLDKDGIVERGMTIEDAEDAMDADPHVLTHWRSRRGEGVQGLAVCADNEASWRKARAAILAAYPADEAALCKEIRGARSHSIVCLPGTDKGACEMWVADDAERKAFAAENEIKNRAIAIPATARPRPRGESICEAAAKAWHASDLAEYIATKKGEVATSKKGGAEWIVGKAKGKGSISVREIDGRAVAKDFADGAPQRDAVDWVMELEGLRDKGEAARRAAEIVGMTLPERKTASRRAPSLGTAEGDKAEENAPAETRKKRPSVMAQAGEWLNGYTCDTFAGAIHSPSGEVLTLDEVAARMVRDFTARDVEISLNTAVSAVKVYVEHNAPAQFDGYAQRIERLADEYSEADRGAIARFCERCGFDEYESKRVMMWLCAACGRAVRRGEKVDNMLVLTTGEQGAQKSTFFSAISKVLCGHDAFEMSFTDCKDNAMKLASNAVAVINELDQHLGKVSAGKIKQVITNPSVTFRVPYDRATKTVGVAAVFGATTNTENPIPASEGDARRYWIIRPRRKVDFRGTPEAESVMREAAHMTLAELEAHADEYDPLTRVGKIWVETDEEQAETCARNQRSKAEDDSTLAIASGLREIAAHAPATWQDDVCGAGALAVAIETGDGSQMTCPGYAGMQWTPPKARAKAISDTLAGRRFRRVSRRYGNRVITGYRIGDMARVFCPELIEQDEENLPDRFGE